MIDNVTAIIVTRGNVPMREVLDSLIWNDVVVWDNSRGADMGAFGRCIAAAGARTRHVYFQDDDLIVPREAQRRLMDEYEPGVLTVNMPTQDYRPGDIRPYLHHLVWQGWGGIMDTRDVMKPHARWLDEGESIDHDYRIVGGDVILGTLYPHKRLDLDAARSAGLHGNDRPRTSAMSDDYARKMGFYRRACEILRVYDLAHIEAEIVRELRGGFRG